MGKPFRATQGPEEEVGNLARACARFAPNFGRKRAVSTSQAPWVEFREGLRATVFGGHLNGWRPAFSSVALPRLPVPAKPGRESGETKEMLGSAQRRQQFLRPGNPTVISVAYSGHLKTFT